MKRRRDKTTGALNRDTCSRRGGKRKKRGGEAVRVARWGERRRRKSQELVDSCCSVYSEDITLLQMLSSEERTDGSEKEGRTRKTAEGRE